MNNKFIVDIVYDALKKSGIPVIRLDALNIGCDNCNFVLNVAHDKHAFASPFNGTYFAPVLFFNFKLLLVVDKKIKVPENVLKITHKILFYGSPDEFIEQVNLMARYAKEIYTNVS